MASLNYVVFNIVLINKTVSLYELISMGTTGPMILEQLSDNLVGWA